MGWAKITDFLMLVYFNVNFSQTFFYVKTTDTKNTLNSNSIMVN